MDLSTAKYCQICQIFLKAWVYLHFLKYQQNKSMQILKEPFCLTETSARHQIQRISVVTCIDTEHCNAQLPQFQKQRATNSSSNENSLSLLYCKMRSLPNKFTHKFTKKSGIYLTRIFLPKLKLVYLSQERKQRSQKIYWMEELKSNVK